MTAAKSQLLNVIDDLQEPEINLLLQIAVRFADDTVASSDDLEAIRQSEKEYAAGETVSHDAINWG